jgi:hypothetical protein
VKRGGLNGSSQPAVWCLRSECPTSDAIHARRAMAHHRPSIVILHPQVRATFLHNPHCWLRGRNSPTVAFKRSERPAKAFGTGTGGRRGGRSAAIGGTTPTRLPRCADRVAAGKRFSALGSVGTVSQEAGKSGSENHKPKNFRTTP